MFSSDSSCLHARFSHNAAHYFLFEVVDSCDLNDPICAHLETHAILVCRECYPIRQLTLELQIKFNW